MSFLRDPIDINHQIQVSYASKSWVVRIPSFPCRRERVKELSELAGEFDLGKALGSRLMVPMTDVEFV